MQNLYYGKQAENMNVVYHYFFPFKMNLNSIYGFIWKII